MIKEVNGDLLQWLRGFYSVAISGSINKGAARIGRDRSAVYHHISNLEMFLQTTLFFRSRRGMKLTEDGTNLLRWTENFFATLGSLTPEMFSDKDNTAKPERVLIGSSSTAVKRIFPKILIPYYAKYPQAQVDILITHNFQCLSMVEAGELDFAITINVGGHSSFCYEPLLLDVPMLVAPKNSGLLRGKPESLEELAQYKLLLHRRQYSYFGFIFSHSDMLTDLPIRLSVSSEDLLLDFLRQGHGVAVIPRLLFHGEEDWLDGYELAHLLHTNIENGLIVRKSNELPAHIQDMFTLLRKECSTLPGYIGKDPQ